MPDPLVAADLDLSADVGLHLAAQIALDAQVALDVVAESGEILVGQVLRAKVAIDAGGGEDLQGPGAPDPEDVGERDLEPLLAGEVDADKTCHVPCGSSVLRSEVYRTIFPLMWARTL